MASELSRLQEWYASHCDHDWEHNHGIGIENIDNPGWILDVDLHGTELFDSEFAEFQENYDDELEWVHCSKHNGKFICNGGPRQLERMIQIFLDWAEGHQTRSADQLEPKRSDFADMDKADE